MSEPRSRRQTRADILGFLLREGSAFRPPLAAATCLSEASLSRILADLRAEGLIEESRRSAPYPGGPTTLVGLDRTPRLGALEVANGRLSVGIGGLDGALHVTQRLPLPDAPSFDSMQRLFRDALRLLRDWTRWRGLQLAQIGVALPGLDGRNDRGNPIIPCDTMGIGALLAAWFPGVPADFANSVVAHAAFHRCRTPDYPFAGTHLFVFLGHGVAGAWVDERAELTAALPPIELGHMVFERDGLPCRCGHRGCVEAYTSQPALAALLGLTEAALQQLGDSWMQAAAVTRSMRQELRRRLLRLGMAIGNTLNVRPAPAVAISGWPWALAEADRAAVLEGIDASLLGGAARVAVAFVPPSSGNDPCVALTFAATCLIRRGGMPQPNAAEAA